ncbi:MAG: glutaredoxin family protein [Thiobacillus sp.]
MSELTLVTRAGCPLCEEMAASVGGLIAHTAHRLVSRDVDADPALKSTFGWDVPLLFAGEIEICRHELNLAAFRQWLRAHP